MTGGTDGEWSVSDIKKLYSPNEEITTTKTKGGIINPDKCSAAVVAVRNVVYEEDVLKANGDLDEMTWEQYKAANGDNRMVNDVEEAYVSMVSKVVGCDASQVEFLLIEKPIFVDSLGSGRTPYSSDISFISFSINALLIFSKKNST